MTPIQLFAFLNPCSRPSDASRAKYRCAQGGISAAVTIAAEGTGNLRWHASVVSKKVAHREANFWNENDVGNFRDLVSAILEGVGQNPSFAYRRFGVHLRKDLTPEELVKIVKPEPYDARKEVEGESFDELLRTAEYDQNAAQSFRLAVGGMSKWRNFLDT